MPRGIPKSGHKNQPKRSPRVEVSCHACGTDLDRTAWSMAGRKYAYCNSVCHRAKPPTSLRHRPSRRKVGDTRINTEGYVTVFMGYDSAKGYPHTRLVLQHRLVMSRMLGRPLLPHENIHHLNGIRSDNRESNLELWVRRQPAGQRAEDLADYAREILGLYGNDDERKAYTTF